MKPFFLVAAMIVLPFALGVKPAKAAGTDVSFMLDSGFIGRPVHLDLFDGAAAIGWDAGAVTKPVTLHITRLPDAEGTTSIRVAFSDSSAITEGAWFNISLHTDSLAQGSLQELDGSLIVASSSAVVVQGVIGGSIPAAASFDVVASPTAIADPNAPTPISETGDVVTLTLDSGFVGRPVSLDLFDGTLKLAWDAKTLVAPTSIRIVRIQGGAGKDEREAGTGVRFAFADASAVSSNGTITVKQKADRVPLSTEHVSGLVNGSIEPASFAHENISYSFSAAATADATPLFQTGIMHTGMATWYRYKGCLCAASPDVPKGTKLKVSRQDDPTRFVVVIVNDYGPDRSKYPDRVIDLDRVAFAKIGNPRGGTLAVTVELADPVPALAKSD
jgi:hypothetical protein